MFFTSFSFIVFIVCVFLLYYLLPKKIQWLVLLVSSFVFYAFSGLGNLVFICATIVSVYLFTQKLTKLNNEQTEYLKKNKELLSKQEKKYYKDANKSKRFKYILTCMLINFGILAVIKYTNFAIINLNSLIKLFGSDTQFALTDFLLPLGISFYTFQTMGYLIDVYRGKYPAERNILKLALFTSFFPQIIQGPISRFDDLSKTLFERRSFSAKDFSYGAQRIIWGFFKKLIIADRLLIAVKTITSSPEQYGGLYVLIGMFIYAIVLYSDFTGGIDITIGIAEALGIRLKENFNHPFYSKDIAEYWRRWHLTMGTWFKDYLFYPLSVCKPMLNFSLFSRKLLGDGFGKRLPVYISTIIVWFATGVWHGATWNFIAWGLTNGFVIIISQELNPLYGKFNNKFSFTKSKAYTAFRIFRTFWLMCFIRTFDCYASVGVTFAAYKSIFTKFNLSQLLNNGLSSLGLLPLDYLVALLGVTCLLVVSFIQHKGGENYGAREFLSKKPVFIRYAVFAGLIFAILVFGIYGFGYDLNQFIYNQF